MDVSVVLCTYNRASSLSRTLSSLRAMRIPVGLDWEVVVVDNNSSDGTADVVDGFIRLDPAHFRYAHEARQGKSFALNTGIGLARGGILAFTDDDVTVDPFWLARTVKAFEAHDCIGIGGRIVDVWSSDKPAWYNTEGPYGLMSAVVRFELGDAPRPLAVPPFGANMAFTREVFSRFGVFDTSLGPTAGSELRGEDSEFARRLLKAGERLYYVPDAIVYHPVEEFRQSKRYFRRWYYDYGRAAVRIEGLPADAVRYFGVPRYMLRSAGEHALRCLLSRDAKRRFYHELQVRLLAGSIRESRHLRRQA